MNASPRLGRIFGIPITIHWSFILLPILTLYWANSKGADLNTTLLLMGLVVLIFICVVLHELGHALMAKRFGVKTKDIILLPICGMARLEKLPKLPKHELLVALAGPLVNLVLAILLAIPLFIFSTPSTSLIHQLSFGEVNLASIPFLLMSFNLAMVVFNLFPIFPMDGGRILRSLLAMKLKQNKATQIAAYIGQFFALLIVIYGLYLADYTLAFTGLIVFVLATREQRIVAHNELMHTTSIESMVDTNFITLDVKDTIPFALNRINLLDQKFFLVLDQDQVAGYVSDAALKEADSNSVIGDMISYIPKGIQESDSMARASELFQKYGTPILPVSRGKELIGTIQIY